jgi:transposase
MVPILIRGGGSVVDGQERAKYNRDHLRYPSDLTDDEWAYVEPLIPPAKRGGGKRRTDMRAVMNGEMYILSTGCQWRYVPKDFPPRSTFHDYFTWCLAPRTKIARVCYVGDKFTFSAAGGRGNRVIIDRCMTRARLVSVRSVSLL